jgi:type I restriction enzyme S subunit
MGQSPDGETYNLDGEGMIFYQGRTDFGWRFPTVRMFTTAPTRYAKEGDILMSVRAPVGDLNICVEDCCIGRGLAAICEKQHNNSFLYYLLLSKKDVFKQSDAEGTIFGSINKDALYKLPIIIPDVQSVMQFNANVKKIDDYIMLLSRELNHLYSLLSLLNSKLS